MSQRFSVLLLLSLGLLAGRPGTTRAQSPDGLSGAVSLPAPWTIAASKIAAVTAEDGVPPDPGYVENRLLVHFAPGTSDEAKRELHAEYGAQVIREIPQLGVQVLLFQADALAMVSTYQARKEIRFAEPDYLATIYGAPDPVQPPLIFDPLAPMARPNDPLYSQQWHHAKIDSEKAWDYDLGEGIVAAIIDTGVNCNHTDLSSKCVAGYDFVNGDSDPRDDYGHGTHVAGIAAAATNNNIGVTGVGWDVKFMPVKSCGASGNCSHSAIAAGITWAVDHGADVINMSIGGYFTSTTLRNAVAYAIGKDVPVVVAAGNDNTSNPTYPCALPDVTCIAATTQSDTRASFSNYGDYIDLSAPGVGILSTVMSGGYQAWSGTSMASPIVAGAAALLLGQDPSRTPAQVEQLLADTAEDLGSPGWDPLFGWGRIDAGRALAGGQNPAQTPQPTSTRPPETAPPPSATPTPSGDWVQQVEDLINRERDFYGLPPLYTDGALRQAAAVHVNDMATHGFCGHGGSNSSTPYDRMRDAGYLSPYGEIVACGQTSPAAVVAAWMNSSGHRAIILCNTCTELGAGFEQSTSEYQYYWAVDFGSEPVTGPTPTVAHPTAAPSATLLPPTATATMVPPMPTPPGGIEAVLTPPCERIGWVVSSQPNVNHFGDEDTYTGTWNSRSYHGAMQFDLEAIPSSAHLNYARLEITGRSTEFLGDTGTWSVNLLATDVDPNFANHGYTTIHNAGIEATLLPLLGVGDLDAGRTNTFTLTESQLTALRARVNGSRLASFRMDGPTGGSFSNLFTWDSGCGPDPLYDGPRLTVNYSTEPPSPVPTATPTEIPPTETTPTPTEGPSPTATETPMPPTPTATAPPVPTLTPTDTPPPPPPTAWPGIVPVEMVPLCTDVGWVVQGQPGNHFGDDNTYTGYYHGLIYHGAVQIDLSSIPPGSAVHSARLTLTGQSTRYLSPQGNGIWHIRLLKPSIDAGWPQHSYIQISDAEVHSTLDPEPRQVDLGVGVRNEFILNRDQRWALEERIATTQKVSFRFDGPRIGLSNIADWDSGCGVGERHPPVLSVVYGPPGSGEPTPTEPPENLDQALEMIAAINRERANAGLGEVTLSDALMRSARVHNRDMIANRIYGPIGSDGSTPADRVAREGFQASAVGEARAGGTSDVEAVIAAWLTRPERDVILTPEYTHIGVHYMFSRQTAYGHYWTVDLARAAGNP